MKTENIVETVRFRLKSEVTPEAQIALSEGIASFLKGRAGFISRSLSLSADGTFLDHVVWEDMDAALAAQTALGAHRDAAAILPLIDEASVDITHAPFVTRQVA